MALATAPDAGWVAAWAACEATPGRRGARPGRAGLIEPATAYAFGRPGDLGVGLRRASAAGPVVIFVATAATAGAAAGHVVHAVTG